MLKILLFLILFQPVFLAQSFINENKTWHVGQGSGFVPGIQLTEAFRFQGDSIINNISYAILQKCMDSSLLNWINYGFFREDTLEKRVYWLINNQEELLYDFNLEIGDTAKVISAFAMPYPQCPFEMIVDSIVIENFFGTPRKRFYFNTPFFNGPETWLEGIGNLFGILENKVFMCSADYAPELLCYKENGDLKYINPVYNACYLNAATLENKYNDVSFVCYPNPTTGKIKLSFSNNENKQIAIYNMDGQLVHSKNCSQFEPEFQLSIKGVYTIYVQMNDQIMIRKLVVY